MAYIKVTNGNPESYSIGKLRRDNPSISFPKHIPSSVLEDFGIYELVEESEPDFDPATQTAYQEQAPVLESGQWVQKWVVVDKTSEELASEAEVKKSGVREERDSLLDSSDWTQIADAPVDQAAWATYRQALRDITDQSGFPENVSWPTKP